VSLDGVKKRPSVGKTTLLGEGGTS
jgi:hypothetical protein